MFIIYGYHNNKNYTIRLWLRIEPNFFSINTDNDTECSPLATPLQYTNNTYSDAIYESFIRVRTYFCQHRFSYDFIVSTIGNGVQKILRNHISSVVLNISVVMDYTWGFRVKTPEYLTCTKNQRLIILNAKRSGGYPKNYRCNKI